MLSQARRVSFALVAALTTSTITATAQQAAGLPDSVRAEIHTTLRAFYFNLAHQDWEAVSADILPAKVVAHRPAPDAFVLAATAPARSSGHSPAADDPVACPAKGTIFVDQAAIAVDGDWAEVSVPRCVGSATGVDEFRLIHFERRWRFVYIDLFQTPLNLSAGR